MLGSSAIIASNIFFSILLFLLLNCYNYVHITHFHIAPQFLDVFLSFLFTFLFVWFIQIYLQVQRHSLFLLLFSISSISFCFSFGVSISAYIAHPYLPLEYLTLLLLQGFPGGSEVKESACSVEDLGSIPGSGRSPGEGNGTHSSILAWRIPWIEEPGRL